MFWKDIEKYYSKKWAGKMKIMVFKCNIFEHGYLIYFSMKVTQISYSDSSNPFGGKRVSNFLFRLLLFFYDTLNIFQNIFRHFFTFDVIKK